MIGELEIYETDSYSSAHVVLIRAKACICHPARSIYNKPINVYVKQKMCSKASSLFLHAVSAINCDLFKTACAFIIGLS